METIYNLFMFYNEDTCYEIGVMSHEVSGTDNEKLQFLTEHITNDLKTCERITLSPPTTLAEENLCNRLNKRSRAIIEVLEAFNVLNPLNALVIITPVVNDNIYFDCSLKSNNHNDINEIRKQMNIKGSQIDWLYHYKKDDGFDMTQLIDDDYMKAIRLTFQNGLYLSSMKLLLSCIDSIGYIEFGSRFCFKEWLNTYADLRKIGITTDELWELRNGILHMSNLESEKVRKGKVNRISFFVAEDKEAFFDKTESVFYFNFKALIHVYAEALEKWINSYNETPDKFDSFVERYDKTISDNRLFLIHKSEI